jgi:hypothetical protein
MKEKSSDLHDKPTFEQFEIIENLSDPPKEPPIPMESYNSNSPSPKDEKLNFSWIFRCRYSRRQNTKIKNSENWSSEFNSNHYSKQLGTVQIDIEHDTR